jgi:hypothetical protein
MAVPLPQVLLAEMPILIDDLLREALADVNIEIMPRGAGIDSLRQVEEDGTPPIVIVVAAEPAASRFERDLLRPHPDAVILRVEDGGQMLTSRVVQIIRRAGSTTLTTLTLVEAIRSAPSWRQRFA